uniref:uncharacterized protein LOC104266402 n=1 Tax=Ciona intestinalis TaxID=7719 RepID=UPI000180CA3A|nr:uncharacterized protein LOC104266402 [Ciona intestinalis]|eukprot:XP_009860796.1 uncharacterized protein LOC104266402 [Ciona intestinalis]
MTRNMNWLTIVVLTSLVTSSFQEVTTPESYDYTPSNSTYEYSYDYGSEYESNSTMIEENSEEENSFMMTVEQIGSGVTSIQGLVDQIEDAQNAGQTYLQLPEQLDPAKTNVTLEVR